METSGAPHWQLPPQPDLTAEQWERIARFLFDRLDDIDTISDMAKGDDAAYRQAVERRIQRRFQVAATDGYGVVFFPLTERQPEERPS